MFEKLNTTDFKSLISDNRTFIMGCAMIGIMLFHQVFLLGNVWGIFHHFGHWGVEMFLFVSGFGVVHSLRKNTIKVYYRNRAERLIPSCLILGVILGTLYVTGVWTTGFYTESVFAIFTSLWLWYIPAIIVYYLLAPFVLKAIDRWGWLVLLFVAAICVLGQYTISIPKSVDPFIRHFTWMIPRFPVFVLGMLSATKWFEIPLKYILPLSTVMLVVAIFFTFKFHPKWNFLLVGGGTISICYFIALLAQLAEKIRVRKSIEFFGKYSLQLYMVHQPIFYWMLRYHTDGNGLACFVIAFILSAISAYVLNLLATNIICRKKV